jgi:hypothetical protein
MNRELKFKAYDSNLNQMITDLEEHYIIVNDTNELKIGVFDVDEDYYELTPLQFTGFKDCEKTDIYDGDILSDEVMTDEGLKMSLQQVFWDAKKGCWMLDFSHKQNKSSSDMLYSQLLAYDYKIVGNIYENPLNIES